jgi:hypothetical protein
MVLALYLSSLSLPKKFTGKNLRACYSIESYYSRVPRHTLSAVPTDLHIIPFLIITTLGI